MSLHELDGRRQPLLVVDGTPCNSGAERLDRLHLGPSYRSYRQLLQLLDDHDLVDSPTAAIARIYDAAGLEPPPELDAFVEAYHRAQPRDAHGTRRYAPEDFGLDPDALRDRHRWTAHHPPGPSGGADVPRPGPGGSRTREPDHRDGHHPHGWRLSRDLVSRVSTPVFPAGGLGPDNVVDAIARVEPAGVDSETHTSRTDDRRRKDLDRGRAFISCVRGGVRPVLEQTRGGQVRRSSTSAASRSIHSQPGRPMAARLAASASSPARPRSRSCPRSTSTCAQRTSVRATNWGARS